MSDREESEQQGGSLPGKIWSGREVFFETIFRIERLYLARLGNKEEFEKWTLTEFFAGAREEWLGAWERFARGHGQEPLLNFRAKLVEGRLEGRVELGVMKELLLISLRRLDDHEDTLRNMAAVIHAAARRGDVEFFKKMSVALRGRGRRVGKKAEGFFLGYYILCHWFSGMLWLMADKPGWAALCAYTGREDITKDSYRMECYRLGLKGYKDRGRKPLVGFDPVKGMHEIP